MNNSSTTFEIFKSQPKNKLALKNVIIADNGPNRNPILNTITFWTTSKELKSLCMKGKSLEEIFTYYFHHIQLINDNPKEHFSPCHSCSLLQEWPKWLQLTVMPKCKTMSNKPNVLNMLKLIFFKEITSYPHYIIVKEQEMTSIVENHMHKIWWIYL